MTGMTKFSLAFLEAQIVDDMSRMFKLFKNKFLTIEKILRLNITFNFKMQSIEDLEHLEIESKNILKQQQKIIEKLLSHTKYLSIFKMVFYRLFSRLVQMVHYYNTKNNNIKQEFKQYCQNIQTIVYNGLNKDANYLQSLTQICQLGKNFIIKLLSHSHKQQFQEIIFQKKSINSSKSDMIIAATNNEQILLKRYQNKLNETFHNLKVLNIDYQNFKTGFYDSRSHQTQLYNQMLQKNQQINSEIIEYRKSFGFYKLRRHKHHRKTKPKNISLITSVIRKIQHKTKQSQASNNSSYNPQITIQSQDIKEIFSSKIFQTKKRPSYIQKNNMNKTSFDTLQQNQQKIASLYTETSKVQQNFFKITSKNSKQYKKVTLKMHKLSLKSQELQQKRIQQIIKKKYTLLCNERKRISQNFQGFIQGHKINESEIRKSQIKKQLCYQLF